MHTWPAPLTFVIPYPAGIPERAGMIGAYGEVQRLLCITGVRLCIPFLVYTLVLRNPRFGNKQILNEAESGIVEVAPTEGMPDLRMHDSV